ncbi:MAG: DUF4339 domain-containing protein [Planctomycetota bacterium]
MSSQPQQQWYYSRDGKRVGPLSASDLKKAADNGHLTRADLVWKEGLSEWVQATRVKGLFPDTPPPVPQNVVQLPTSPGSPPETPAASSSPTIECRFCGEVILAVAKKCKHCGEFLDNSLKKQGKAVFKASGDFIGVLCSYHIMDSSKQVLAKLKPNQSFDVPVPRDATMYVWYSCGFAGSVEVQCRAFEVNRFSISMTQMGMGCVVSRVDVIDSD